MSIRIIQGDVREELPKLPADYFDCIVTSPPYFGLRDYGTATWVGGDPGCDHKGSPIMSDKTGLSHPERKSRDNILAEPYRNVGLPYRDICGKCGARRIDAQIGLEATLDEYLETMVAVCRQLRRVLKPSGVFFLNVSDSYSSGARRAVSYDMRGKEPEDCQESDCFCQSLCDVCRAAYRIGKSHSGSRRAPMRPASIFESNLGHMEFEHDHLPTSGSKDLISHNSDAIPDHLSIGLSLGGVPRAAVGSTMPQSSRLLPDECSHCGNCGVSLSVSRLNSRAKHLNENIEACNCGIGTTSDRSFSHGNLDTESLGSACLDYTTNLKPKDLMLVPERLGIALQHDGWWLRSHIIWHKLNPMPESVTDRPTSAHETIWLLTKSARYFWDGEAINETSINAGRSFPMSDKSLSKGQSKGICIPPTGNALKDSYSVKETRNIRNVWSVASHSFSGAHFATMPPEIAERCIKAGSSERGCCPECGAPWVRLMSKREGEPPDNTTELQASRIHKKLGCQYTKFMNDNPIKTVGWQPSCKHYDILDPIPARILDPFAGSGTTGLVADRLGRDATLIDLNTSYIDMAVNRIRDDSPLFAEVAAE